MPVLSTLGAAIANVYGFTSGLIKDQYFNLVSLLLPGNGTNGATNNSFVDSSTANSGTGWPITRNGDVTQGTFSPFSQTGWSNYFNGSAGLVYADSTNLEPGSGDFTWEAWVFHTAAIGSDSFYYYQPSSGIGISRNTSGKVQINQSGVATILTSTGSVNSNEWVHVAVVRSGSGSNNVKVYLNGTADATTATSTANFAGTGSIDVGKAASGSYMTGYFSNLRFCKAAVYTSNFTPSTSPLTTTSQGATNCNLLICQSNRFKDNSNNDFSATISGSPSVTPFSPFAPTAKYEAAAVGGSGYFDGSGDYLTAPDNAAWDVGSSNFTIEGWFYPTGSPAQPILIGQWTSSYSWVMLLSNDSNRYIRGILYTGSAFSDYVSTAPLQLNAWNHCAFVRESNTVSLYLNGSRVLTNTFTGSVATSTSAVSLGANSSGADPYLGYMSSTRVVVGTALYSGTTYTVPTAPLTAVSGTQLLLNFTNAGVVDATAKNVLETEGNAQISTAQSKWGGGSISFNGSNSFLLAPANRNNDLAGDFTIECWIRFASVGNAQIVSAGGGSVNGAYYWQYYTSQLQFGINGVGAIATPSWTPSANQWYHLAVTRSGTTVRQFVDGTQLGSNATSSQVFVDATTQVGYGGAGYLNGFIDDLRVTKGYARYTANFTAPTAPFPLQ